MSHDDGSEDPWARRNPPPPLTPQQRRRRLAGGALLVTAVVVGLALTTASETIPAGVMPGAQMTPGMEHEGITIRDIEGSLLDLPGGQDGAVMFMSTEGCAGCVDAARALDEAVAGAMPVTIVSVDTEESKEDFGVSGRVVGERVGVWAA